MSMQPSAALDPLRPHSFEYARAFLGRARELSNASSVCIGLEGNIAHLLTNYAGKDRAMLIRELQHMDILNQLLVALSSYASVLGSQCVAGTPLDVDGASHEMGLARVAASLRAVERREQHSPSESAPGGGELDLL